MPMDGSQMVHALQLVLFTGLRSWILRDSESPLVIVSLTLVLALLLYPIRRGLQQLINRRYMVDS